MSLTASKSNSTFTDNDSIPSWALTSVIAMQENQLVSGYPDGRYGPQNNLTRAEGFTLLANIIERGLLNVSTPVTGITLEPTAISLSVNESRTLTSTVLPVDATNKNVTWVSDNTKSVTVDDNGVIKAIAGGKATITATTADGGFTAKSIVTVGTPVTGITIAPSTFNITVGSSRTLTATISPDNATNKNIAWTSSNTNVATVDNNGVVRAVAVGTATITATTEDGNFTTTSVVTVSSSGTDPLLIDTDGNGISDADEDFDGDGLTNIQEQEIGTRPDVVDTDGDGLSDYAEVHMHETDPLNRDTDDDGLTDDEELKLGLNPNNPSTHGVPDNTWKIQQTIDDSVLDDALRDSDNWLTPQVFGNVPGDISKNVIVEESFLDSFDDNRAVLSDIIDIYTSYDEPLTLSFSFNQTYPGDIKNLTIVSFGEDGLELVDTVLDVAGGVISGEFIGNGTYFVIDLDEFLKGLGIDVFANIASDHTEYSSLTTFDLEIDENDVQTSKNTSDYSYENEVIAKNDLQKSEGTSDSTYDNNEIESIDTSTSGKIFDYFYDNEGNIIEQVERESIEAFESFPFSYSNTSPSTLSIDAFSTGATGKADIVFVIDTTGSMASPIANVKNNVNAFAARLVNEYNVDANFSLIEYRDITVDGVNSTKQHKNVSSNWFTNVNSFSNTINGLSVGGGGDTPETPIDGLEMARRLDWRSDATKFVVLVTDAGFKTNNTFGISNMTEMASLFANDGIIVSVIAASSTTYATLTENTNGLYGYISGNFSNILLGLADKIGEVTNVGEWVFLNDFQAVRLGDTLANAAFYDTDNDGLSDAQELGTSREVNMMGYISSLANRYSVPVEYYTGKTTITVWNCLSNPTLLDTDYDGIPDGNQDYDGSAATPDSRPKRAANAEQRNTASDGNAFSGTLNANDYTFDVKFSVDYSLFFGSNRNYQDELAVLGAVYSTIAYHGTTLNINNGATINGRTEEAFTKFGLKNYKNYKLADYFTDDDISEMSLGHREVTYKGVTTDIIVVAVRGTDATIEEWSSNFDVGADTSAYWDRNNSYWRNKNNHKGFDVAANRLYDEIMRYVGELDSRTSKTIYIMGHSRGAAIANILGAKFEDNSNFQSFTYTYATPMTTESKGSYNTIHNIVNKDDLVPYLPLSSWGFDKYGKTHEISITSEYENKWGGRQEGTWEAVFGTDYNNNGHKDDTIRKFGSVVNSRDEVYTFTDDDKTAYTYSTKYNTRTIAESAALAQMEKYGARISKFCEVYIKETDPLLGSNYFQVQVKQKPAALMMILTDVVGSQFHDRSSGTRVIQNYEMLGKGEDNYLFNDIGFYVAKKYDDAKISFVKGGVDSASSIAAWFRMGGMVHTHMPGSYYFLAYDYKNLLPTK